MAKPPVLSMCRGYVPFAEFQEAALAKNHIRFNSLGLRNLATDEKERVLKMHMLNFEDCQNSNEDEKSRIS